MNWQWDFITPYASSGTSDNGNLVYNEVMKKLKEIKNKDEQYISSMDQLYKKYLEENK